MAKVEPELASNGGNVIFMQVENEFNGDYEYQNWAVDMARNLTTAVPWNLCHDQKLCAQVNTDAAGAYAYKALCTINGFWMEEFEKNLGQPSPKWIFDQRRLNPGQVTTCPTHSTTRISTSTIRL